MGPVLVRSEPFEMVGQPKTRASPESAAFPELLRAIQEEPSRQKPT
jgi:hypothetical protein